MKPPASKNQRVLVGLLLLAATLLAYLPLFSNGFVCYDDDVYVTENPAIQNGINPQSFRWAWTATYAANWHPLTWISHMLDWQLFGENPTGHHAISLVFHLLNTVLVLLVFERLTKSISCSAVVAGLFALHPLHVESVAWIAERKDVLSTFFFVLTLWFHAAFVAQPRLSRRLLVIASLALGLCAKPMLVTVPFVLLLLDWWPLQRTASWRNLVLEKIPLFLLAALSSVVTLLAQSAGQAVVPLTSYPLLPRLFNAPVFFITYLLKTAWPANLAIFYPHPGGFLPAWHIAGSTILLALITVGAWTWRHRHPYVLMGWLWYLGTLIPVIGVVQVGQQAVADRYTYVPLLGVFVIVVFGTATLSGKLAPKPRRMLLITLVGSIGLVLAACTFRQVGRWRDSETLFTHALAVTGPNPVANTNLGVALGKAGRLDESVAHLREAVRLQPHDPVAHLDLGTALNEQGKSAEAVEHFARAVDLAPHFALAHANLGIVLADQGKLDQAQLHLERALTLKPDLALAHLHLAFLFFERGNYQQAWSEAQLSDRFGLVPPQDFIMRLRQKLP